MEKVKIHPMILAALLISSVAMALYAYQNFRAEEIGYGIVFVLIGLLLVGLVVFGWLRNRKASNDNSVESR